MEDINFKSIDTNCLIHKSDYDKEEAKELFYTIMKQNTLDFDDINPESKLPYFIEKVVKSDTVEYNKFNNILYKLNKEHTINIVDSIAYIIEDWLEPYIILKCLDELNYYTLMNSLQQKYQLSGNKTDLNEFFV